MNGKRFSPVINRLQEAGISLVGPTMYERSVHNLMRIAQVNGLGVISVFCQGRVILGNRPSWRPTRRSTIRLGSSDGNVTFRNLPFTAS
jgi:hypothetical protein